VTTLELIIRAELLFEALERKRNEAPPGTEMRVFATQGLVRPVPLQLLTIL
jgi:hypothetical protein